MGQKLISAVAPILTGGGYSFFIHKYPYVLKFLLYNFLITMLILAYVCRRATPVKSAVFWLHMFGITTEITGITHFDHTRVIADISTRRRAHRQNDVLHR